VKKHCSAEEEEGLHGVHRRRNEHPKYSKALQCSSQVQRHSCVCVTCRSTVERKEAT
jgi:hypothetical protein